nr:GntR family transcriptional regulator [uncultured Oscillibacter sp.]
MAALSEQAYEKIKDLVLKAEPGTFFSVRKCANDLQFSYTPTREALLRLHAEGMLRLVPNVGFFTAQMDLRDITDIYQSRECVEQYVLPLVLPHFAKEDIKYLWEQVNIQERAVEAGDFDQYTDSDIEFHCFLINKLNNKRLMEFYHNICSRYRSASNSLMTDLRQPSIEEHRQFLHSVERGDYEQAIQTMRRHTQESIKRMREGYIQIRSFAGN